MAKLYKPRIADDILSRRLRSVGAVLVEGAKWCGKTTTSEQLAESVLYMQHPIQKAQNLSLASIDPTRLLQGDTPRLIDEWQLAPELWDAVRFEVDQRGEFNQFILTGSAVPAKRDEISHTGTGRIARMKMRPMSLYESGDSNGSVSLAALFEGKTNIDGYTETSLDQLAYWICRGGWPKAIDQEQGIALQQARDYFDAVVSVDISEVDNVKRDTERAKRILRSFARHVGLQAPISTIRADIMSGVESSISDDTITDYLSALSKLFVLENATAWSPNLRSKTAIRTSETRYFTDPSIGAAALGAGPADFINDLNTMGFYFENMCIRDLRVYAECLDGEVYHYRDKSGLECDAVVHLRNGSYGLIEVKLGGDKLIQEGVDSLSKLANKIDTQKMKAPAFKMVLVGTGNYAYRREDDILVVPIACLKP